MADIGTPAGAADWAYSWLNGDPAVPWATRRTAMRKIASTAERIRRDYPAASRMLRAILMFEELNDIARL